MRRRSGKRPRLAASLCLLSFALFAVAGSLQLLYYVFYAVAPPSTEGWQLLRQQPKAEAPPGSLQLALQQGELQTVYAQEQQQQLAAQEDTATAFSSTNTSTGGVHSQYAKQASETLLASRQAAGQGSLDAAADTALQQPVQVLPQQQQPPQLSALASAALICFCYNRPPYLEKTLASLASLAGLQHLAVYVSQDGNHTGVQQVVQRIGAAELAPPHTKSFTHWQRERIPQLGNKQPGHAWLTQHYKWGLDRVFFRGNHSHVIIIEDDMLFSPDFLTLFEATAPLLEHDPSLWCVSSWNDNGLASFAWNASRLFRTSYFPGLGWMMRRQLWEELSPKFPRQAWDHWFRLPTTAQGRECISPEVNRNSNIGETGANMNKSMFRRFLKAMTWATEATSSFGDLSYLLLPQYTAHMQSLVTGAELWRGPPPTTAAVRPEAGKVYLITYKGEQYPRLARQWKIWPFPRGHHRNVVYLPYKGSVWLLADARFCPLLLPELRLLPPDSLQKLPGAQGGSCTDTCMQAGLLCSADDFWFINLCEALGEHFACEAGCTVESGYDVPCYVARPDHTMHGACLVSQQQPRCEAHHNATRRLCPCVSPPGEEAAPLPAA